MLERMSIQADQLNHPEKTLIRLLAKQAVKAHLQGQAKAPSDGKAERPNRPVQIPQQSA